MFSNNRYDFFGREKEVKSPFMGAFDHDGLKRSNGVRPVHDILREASLVVPDTSNFSEDNGKDEFGFKSPINKEFPLGGTPYGESEYSVDSNYVGSDDFDVKNVGLDDFVADKGLRIGNEVKEGTDLLELGVKKKKVSDLKSKDMLKKERMRKDQHREKNKKEFEESLRYRDNDQEELSQHLDSYLNKFQFNDPYANDTDVEAVEIDNIISEVRLNEQLSDEAKKLILRAIMTCYPFKSGESTLLGDKIKNFQGMNSEAFVTRRLGKESKLPEKDKKYLSNYWISVYPKDYTKKMVDDCEVEEPKKSKKTK